MRKNKAKYTYKYQIHIDDSYEPTSSRILKLCKFNSNDLNAWRRKEHSLKNWTLN